MNVIQENKVVPKLRFKGFKDDNGNNYPDWEEKSIGDLGETFNGLTGKTKEDFGIGKPYIQYMQIFNSAKINVSMFGLVNVDSNENQKKVQYGDVFFTTSSETPMEIGYASVLTEDVKELYLNSFCFGFRPHSLSELFPDFSAYLFRSMSMRKQIVRLAQGSTRYNMSKVQLMKLKIYLPILKEQKKIAGFFSSVDDKIQKLNRKKELLQEFKKGVMQKIFSQELHFKDNNGNDYPDWEEKRIKEICSKKSSSISAGSLENNSGDYIIYGASGIYKKVDFYTEESKYVSIVKDGSGVGNVTLCSPFSSVIGTLDTIHSIGNMNIYFIYTVLQKLNFLKYKVGGAIPHIYFKDYSKEYIMVPVVEEQNKIANFLSSIDKKIDLVSSQLENTKVFKKGLLQQMFV